MRNRIGSVHHFPNTSRASKQDSHTFIEACRVPNLSKQKPRTILTEVVLQNLFEGHCVRGRVTKLVLVRSKVCLVPFLINMCS